MSDTMWPKDQSQIGYENYLKSLEWMPDCIKEIEARIKETYQRDQQWDAVSEMELAIDIDDIIAKHRGGK